jgi:hypothetical protein
MNKEVMRHLRNIVFDRQVFYSWSKYLPFVQRILLAMKNESIGVAPAKIIFGSSIDLNKGILTPLGNEETESLMKEGNYKDWMSDMLGRQSVIIRIARETLSTRNLKHLAGAEDIDPTVFPVESYVLAENRNSFTSRKETVKLRPFLKGPFKVVANSSNFSKYTVLNPITGRLRLYHVKNLRAFRCDPTSSDPSLFALRDGDFYLVDAVINYKPKTFTSRRSLSLLVRWKVDKSETWEPWSGLRRVKAVQDWARSHSSKLIRALCPVDCLQEELESDEENEKEEENLEQISFKK